jgi:hypothetical protein
VALEIDKDDGGLDGTDRFEPDFLDNLDKKKADRAFFIVKHPDERELQKIDRVTGGKLKSGRGGLSFGAIQRDALKKRDYVFKHYVIECGNWVLKDSNGEKTEITNIEDLVTILSAKKGIAGAVRSLWDQLFDFIVDGARPDEGLVGESS